MSVIPMSTTKGARPLQVKTGSLTVEKIPPIRIKAPTIVTGTNRNRLFQLSLGMSLRLEFRAGEDRSCPPGSGKASYVGKYQSSANTVGHQKNSRQGEVKSTLFCVKD